MFKYEQLFFIERIVYSFQPKLLFKTQSLKGHYAINPDSDENISLSWLRNRARILGLGFTRHRTQDFSLRSAALGPCRPVPGTEYQVLSRHCTCCDCLLLKRIVGIFGLNMPCILSRGIEGEHSNVQFQVPPGFLVVYHLNKFPDSHTNSDT